MRVRAVWNGVVLADSADTVVVEGNHYFPPESVNRQYFTPSSSHTVCPWKGIASYHTVVVDGGSNRDAAWFYPHPSLLARRIKGRVAFWHGVRVEPVDAEPVTEPADRGER
jgi:uncharacterized protein (DUF427 family)